MPMQKSPSNRSSGGISPRVTRNNSKRLSETSNGKAKRQKVAEITVMGGPVKRNMNAYMHFSSSVRKAIVEEIGTKDFKSVATAVKGRWDKLTEEEKKKFQDLANADKLRYKWMELLSHCFVGRDNSRLDLDEETMKELVDDLLAMPATNAGANKWNCVSIFFVAIMRAEPRIKHYFVHQGGTNVVVTALQMVKDKLVKGRDQGIEDLALAALYCTSQLPIVLNTLRTHKDLAKTVKEISKLPEQFGNLKGHAESIIADWKSMTGIKNSLPGQSPGSNRSAESPSNSANPCAMTPENEAARTKVIDVLTKSLDSTDGIAAEKYPRAARAIERELIKAYGMGSKYMDQARALQTNLRNNEYASTCFNFHSIINFKFNKIPHTHETLFPALFLFQYVHYFVSHFF